MDFRNYNIVFVVPTTYYIYINRNSPVSTYTYRPLYIRHLSNTGTLSLNVVKFLFELSCYTRNKNANYIYDSNSHDH